MVCPKLRIKLQTIQGTTVMTKLQKLNKSQFNKKKYDVETIAPQDRIIRFEDEAFKIERFEKGLDVNLFIDYIIEFYDQEEKLLFLIPEEKNEGNITYITFTNIFNIDVEQRAEEAYKAATDLHYDPFREKLQKTLEQYERAMDDPDNFKSQKEREIAEKVITDLKNQLHRIDKIRRADGNDTERDLRSMVKSISTSLEDKRDRGMREIFAFYSQQHLPQGLQFGDIQNKKNLLDLGEFLIFCKDFQIPLNKKKAIEIFKRSSKLRQLPIVFDEFLEAIDKIGIEINNERIGNIKKRLKEIAKIEKEQNLLNPKHQKELQDKLQKEVEKNDENEGEGEKEDNANDKSREDPTSKPETTSKPDETTSKNDEKDEESKADDDALKSPTGKTSKTGDDGDSGSDESESKSKTTKTVKTGKTLNDQTEKTSKADESMSDDGTESRPISMKSKNKSVRFSTLGNNQLKKELEKANSDDQNRSLDLIQEEGLEVDIPPDQSVHPLIIEKERLQRELQKYETKTTEDCHEDIMNILEVHDPQKFRKKAKGVVVVPFAMKDFYYRIAKHDDIKKERKSKLSAAQIRAKVEEMKMRREQERWIRERQMEKAKRNMEEQQARKLERLRKQKMNTASKKRKVYIDGHSQFEDDVMSIPQSSIRSPKKSEIKESYRMRK